MDDGLGNERAATLTWNKASTDAPTASSPMDSAAAVVKGTWIELDLTGAVAGDGTYSFGLTTTSSDSRLLLEPRGANPPQLVVSLG